MNTSQKIVLTSWLAFSFVIFALVNIYTVLIGGVPDLSTLPTFLEINGILLLSILIVLGIPTFIIFKIWKHKRQS